MRDPRDVIRLPRANVVTNEGSWLPGRLAARVGISLSGRFGSAPAPSDDAAARRKPPVARAPSITAMHPDGEWPGDARSSGAGDPERDRVLMRLVCEHDQAALAALYDQYAAQVNGLALSIVRSPALAEEATHDVFLRVWQQPTAYDPARGTFAGWLMRVARNRSIDLLRRRRDDSIDALDVEGSAVFADPGPGPEEQAMTRLHRLEVIRALHELSPDHRRLLELAYYTGLSQSQIAAHLGRPLGTVKSQIRSAMLRLADRLAPSDTASGTPAQTSGGEST